MGAKEQMIQILRSGEASRINFTFTGGSTGGMSLGRPIQINGAALRDVATGLSNGSLRVVENHFDENRMVYAARNDSANGFEANTFYLGNTPTYSRDFNGLVVHEAVHAYFDLQRRTIQWIDNEAAAYLAQAAYLRNSGYPESRIGYGTAIRIATIALADMRSSGNADMLIEALRDSLRNNPDYESYIGGTFTGDA